MPFERKPPYYAAIFTSLLAPEAPGYEAMSQKMVEMVSRQKGFLGFESARGPEGLGITVSYWDSLESIRAWKEVTEHREAQAKGREWYSWYRIRLAIVQEDRHVQK